MLVLRLDGWVTSISSNMIKSYIPVSFPYRVVFGPNYSVLFLIINELAYHIPLRILIFLIFHSSYIMFHVTYHEELNELEWNARSQPFADYKNSPNVDSFL